MGEYTGTALYVSFGAGTTVLSGASRKFSTTEGGEMIDATAGNDAVKNWISSYADASASISMLDQSGGSVLWTALARGTTGTLTWAPEGTTTTKPKHTAEAIVMSRKRDNPYNDVVTLDVEWKITSVVIDAAY